MLCKFSIGITMLQFIHILNFMSSSMFLLQGNFTNFNTSYTVFYYHPPSPPCSIGAHAHM